MGASSLLRFAILLDAIFIAIGHVWYVRAIFRAPLIGGYFLVSLLLFLAGGIVVVVAGGKLFRFANIGLILLAIIDNALIVYTRTMPSPFFNGRVLSWSAGWFPTGVVQVFIAQTILIIMSAYALKKAG